MAAAPQDAVPGDRETLQHALGRLSARERIALLCDPGSFREHRHPKPGEGREGPAPVLAGRGRVYGRPVYAYAHDGGVGAGALGQAMARRVEALLRAAAREPAPVVALADTRGLAREDGPGVLAAYAGVLAAHCELIGRAPQIALLAGPCPGAAALVPGLADLVFMVRGASSAYLTGPEVARAVVQEPATEASLGGASQHAPGGLAHGVYEHEVEALLALRNLCSYLPGSSALAPPRLPTADPRERPEPSLETLLPDAAHEPFDVTELACKVLDEGEFLELQSEHAPNLVTGLGHLGGDAVGVMANQPLVDAGCIDVAAARKGARFVALCHRFNLPLLVIADAPGFMPGSAQERGGLAREAAALLYALSHLHRPRLCLVPRRAYAGAALVMGVAASGRARTLAWPGVRVGLSRGEAKPAPRGAGWRVRTVAPRHTRRALCHALALLLRSPPAGHPHRRG